MPGRRKNDNSTNTVVRCFMDVVENSVVTGGRDPGWRCKPLLEPVEVVCHYYYGTQ